MENKNLALGFGDPLSVESRLQGHRCRSIGASDRPSATKEGLKRASHNADQGAGWRWQLDPHTEVTRTGQRLSPLHGLIPDTSLKRAQIRVSETLPSRERRGFDRFGPNRDEKSDWKQSNYCRDPHL